MYEFLKEQNPEAAIQEYNALMNATEEIGIEDRKIDCERGISQLISTLADSFSQNQLHSMAIRHCRSQKTYTYMSTATMEHRLNKVSELWLNLYRLETRRAAKHVQRTPLGPFLTRISLTER